MNKGQIFSVDFLFAMILMIFFLGTLFGIGEIKNYETKEDNIRNELEMKSQAALITLTNSKMFSCENDVNLFMAYSIDKDKLDLITTQKEFKEMLGLADYNLSLLLDGGTVNGKNDIHSGRNIYAIDLNVLYCEGTAKFSDINACIGGSCNAKVEQKKLTIKVSK